MFFICFIRVIRIIIKRFIHYKFTYTNKRFNILDSPILLPIYTECKIFLKTLVGISTIFIKKKLKNWFVDGLPNQYTYVMKL